MSANQQTTLPLSLPVYSVPFHVRFKQWRLQRGIKSLAQLASITGMSVGNFAAVERGDRKLSESDMRRLAACERWGLSYETMRAWRLMDGLTGSEMVNLAQELERLAPQATSPGIPRTVSPVP